MRRDANTPPRLEDAAVFRGFVLGALIGALLWWWRLPGSGPENRARLTGAGQSLRQQLVPADPVAESLAEGKALAQRRRAATDVDPQP
ncbi:MAG: hypothetical protein MUE40_16750 [Anaerolineae bacterium]|jgi:hypothetical protein|nr:hypothetical protein [Anaerolineae bacterium]